MIFAAESLTFPCFALLVWCLQSRLDTMWVHTVLCTLLGCGHIAAECCLIPSFLSCSCASKLYSHSYFTLKSTWCGWKWGKVDLDLVTHLFFDLQKYSLTSAVNFNQPFLFLSRVLSPLDSCRTLHIQSSSQHWHLDYKNISVSGSLCVCEVH